MKCPHCFQDVQLAWGKYFATLSGYHSCPSCGSQFKLTTPARVILALVSACVLGGGIPAIVVFVLTHSLWFAMGTYFLFAFALVIPLDRWMDDKIRPSKRVRS